MTMATTPGLRALDGVRAFSSIFIVFYHCFRLLAALIPDAQMVLLLRKSFVFRLALLGNAGVDVFLAMSSMLAVYHLLPELEGSCSSASSTRPSAIGASASSSCRGVTPGCATLACTGRHSRDKAGVVSVTQAVLRYYTRRVRRIVPAYAAANLLILLLVVAARHAQQTAGGLSPLAAVAKDFCFMHCPEGIWANALFMMHFLGRRGCGLHLWSTTVQVHAYLLCPLAMVLLQPRKPGFRARLAAALAAAAACGSFWRLHMAGTVDLRFPFGGMPGDGASLTDLREALWWTLGGRVPVLAFGGMLGLLLRSPAALQWLKARRLIVGAAVLLLEAACLHVAWTTLPHRLPHEPYWPPAAAQAYVALLWCGSPLYGATSAGAMLALLLRTDPLHAAAATLLSSRALQPLATLSFSLYLLHEQARFFWLHYLPPPVAVLPADLGAAPTQALLVLTAGTLAVGYAAAALWYHLVEKRF